MRPTKAGNFTVDLPASLRETGGYRIDLFRLEEYQPVLEASFDLTLTN
ncbi:MAG: hypothetical protein MPN21_20485 [Thermoanaerobaculia bacterium]|nr:hypothetical protein [Thermoanaerobaculia bacterium]